MEKAREQSKCSEEWEETFCHAYIREFDTPLI